MAKLKKPSLSVNNKEKAFGYEIIGIVSILISIISLARFGLIGKYLVLTFSLLFGDWYFIFIVLVGFFGIYCLIFHKRIELKSIRYYGIMLILLSLLIITHFSMHEYVSQFEGNALKTTISLYFDYFRSNTSNMIKGGGIVGCICFYISYYLLGKVGTIIISLLILFVGVVFLSKKTMREFFEMTLSIFKKIITFIKKNVLNMVNNIREISFDYGSKTKTRKKTSKITSKNSNETIDKVQLDRCEEIVKILTDAFKHLDVEVQNITYLICEHIVNFFIKTKYEINYKVLEYTIKDKLGENFLIKYDRFNEQVIIEVNKINPSSLSLERASKNISKTTLTYILGIDDRNLLVELDDNLLIIGENQSLIRKYILSIILLVSKEKKYNINNTMLIDVSSEYSEFEIKNINVSNDFDALSQIVDEIDHNLELLNLHHKMNIDEYNLYFSKKIAKKTYFITGVENILYEKGYFDKLLYIVQTCKIAGINIIMTLTKDSMVSSIFLGSVEKKILLKNDFDLSNKMIDNSYFDVLTNDIEGFYKDKDLIFRISLLLMSEDELNNNYIKAKEKES